jgi:GntP family gluconate:H+ symporter
MQPVWILLVAVSIVLLGILVFRMHAFLALLLAALSVALLTPNAALEAYAKKQVDKGDWTQKAAEKYLGKQTPADRVAQGFGKTCGDIAILIALASIIGKCVLDSGAADRIVRSTLRVLGQGQAPLAFLASGYLLGIPVFFDTVFYLMIPLAKAMRLRTGGNYLFYVLTIVAGATMTHSLVPPTPGPLMVASELGVNLGVMILAGCLVGAVSASAGYLFARWANSRMDVPLRESAGTSLAELEAIANRPDRELPPLWLAVIPIVLPVLLISGQTAVETYFESRPREQIAAWLIASEPAINILGDKNVAMLISAAVALATVAWQRRSSLKELTNSVENALAGAGSIILITAAGGALGAAINQCGLSEEIGRLSKNIQPLLILPAAFLITMLIRAAQGSATVAMITAVSLLVDFSKSGDLPFHTVYLALAIGCGSKPFPWMNDSGFWVICKMSGLTEREALRTVTPLGCVMGLAGLIVTMIGAWLLPMK